MTKDALLIFVRNLEAGHVKTRLAATIGNDTALSVYKQLLKLTAVATSTVPVDKIVFYSNSIDEDDAWSNEHYSKQVQQGDDLGEKMNNAFASVFEQEYKKAVLIGTDCPELTKTIILDAFEKLDDVDVVIGPAFDGGYYLIGLKNNCTSLFQNIHWSTNSVLSETIQKCTLAELSFTQLEPLADLDDENDLLNSKLVQI